MNKKEFAAEIAADLDITKKDAETFVDSFLTTMTKVLAAGEDVRFTGFGTFGTKVRAARNGFNPLNGEAIQIPESVKPYFKAGKVLKDSL